MDSIEPIKISDYYISIAKGLHISYKGPIDDKILQALGIYIEELLDKSHKTSKKMFKIFIELAQNVSYYSAERNIFNKEQKDVGVGSIFVEESDSAYRFVTGNLVKNKDLDLITDKIQLINSLDREKLREYKREQRKLPFGKKGGANIGLIQMSLTSHNPLDIEIRPIDAEHSFFSIGVKIDK